MLRELAKAIALGDLAEAALILDVAARDSVGGRAAIQRGRHDAHCQRQREAARAAAGAVSEIAA